MNNVRHKTQADLVAENTVFKPEVVKNKVGIPGIESLHLKPIEEIAETLTHVLRSQPHITEVRWVIGKYIELSSTEEDG